MVKVWRQHNSQSVVSLEVTLVMLRCLATVWLALLEGSEEAEHSLSMVSYHSVQPTAVG